MDYEKLYQDKAETYYHHSRPEMIDFVPSNVRLALEIGCGNGAFGELLKKQRSCTVWGIEPNKDASLEAEKKLDKVINNVFSAELPELIGQKFDAIIFNDVLEHLIDPAEVLNNCKKFLNEKGYIIASIPSIRWYPVLLSLIRYKDFRYQDSGVMDKTHLRFFTLKSMLRLFEDNDFEIVTAKGINKNNSFTAFNILNFLLFNVFEDMKYPQFGITASYVSYRHLVDSI